MLPLLGALVIAFSPPAAANLAPSTVSSLIMDSDSIVRAKVVRLELKGEGGLAGLELQYVYVGWAPKHEFNLGWSGEEEEDRFWDIGQEYVLFLRRTGAESLAPAQAGRSFWPLVPVDRFGPLVTPYVGLLPILNPDIPGLLGKGKVRVRGLPGDKLVEVPVLFLHVLVPAMKSMWHPSERGALHNYCVQLTAGADGCGSRVLSIARRS